MESSYKGTAILKIIRLDSKWVPYEVEVQEDDNPQDGDDDWQLLETDTLPVPDAAIELKEGESVRVKVEYEFSYHKDYWGEWDCDLEYLSQVVLDKAALKEGE